MSILTDCYDDAYKDGYSDGYAKALDDFAERLRMNTSEYEVMDGFGAIEEIVDAVDIDTIFEIAEELRGSE